MNGIMKLWLYQFYVLARMSWPFLIHDFNRHFAVQLTDSISTTLKKWAGLFRKADVGCLFRSKEQFGLGLTSVVDHFERMQIIKCFLLQHSEDADVRKVYESREKRESSETGRVWRPTPLTNSLVSDVSLQLRFPSQVGHQGLGSGNFKADYSAAERRKFVTTAARGRTENRLIAHAHSLSLQGVWLQWADRVTPFDLSWKHLIYGGLGQYVTSFVLNATINCVATPDMLKMWGYKREAYCSLCGAGTMHPPPHTVRLQGGACDQTVHLAP